MAESTGLALAVGSITLANIWVLDPMARGHGIHTELTKGWHVIPATIVFALALGGLERIPDIGPTFAKGLGYIALITVLLTAPNQTTKAPAQNAAKILGYGK